MSSAQLSSEILKLEKPDLPDSKQTTFKNVEKNGSYQYLFSLKLLGNLVPTAVCLFAFLRFLIFFFDSFIL